MHTVFKYACFILLVAFFYLPFAYVQAALPDESATGTAGERATNAMESGQSTKDSGSFARLWKSSIDTMEEALDYLNSGKSKDHKEWYRVGRNPKFRELVRQTFEILSVSDAREKIESVIEHRKRIASLYKENSELLKKKLGATETPEGFWDSTLDKLHLYETKDTIRKEIADNKERISRLEEDIAGIKNEFYAEMRIKNLNISREQVESLFSSIDGEGIVSIIGMAENIKSIQLELQNLVAKESGNIELLKSYSGIYMMLNEALLFAYEEAIENIQEKYLPKLDAIISESRNQLQTAKQKLANTARQNEPILRANIKSNTVTIDVGERYKRYLQKQAQFLRKEKERMVDNVEVATNTYSTIKNSGDLLMLIRDSQSDINHITAFQIPELEILHDESLRKEFDAITSRLQI